MIAACVAASQGDLEALVRLHIQNIDLSRGDYDKRTPMHLAAINGYIEIVEYLVEQGYDVNPKDRWGSTPLNDATDDEVIEYL